MSQDTGLIRRGLLLLALMSVLVVVVLSILFQRPRPALPTEQGKPEYHAATLLSPVAVYPASLAWAGLYQVGQELPSAPGWQVRYNAALPLARLGSANLPAWYWSLFCEMLDEQRQMRNFRVPLEDGRTVPDEAKARETVLMALRALAEWHTKQKELGRTDAARADVYALVDQLATSPVAVLKIEAAKTRSTYTR